MPAAVSARPENAAQAWLDRRFDGLGPTDLEGIIRILCTSDLRPPHEFRELWVNAATDLNLEDEELFATEDSSDQNALLLVCDQTKEDEVRRLLDLIAIMDSAGYDAPPMLLMPHTTAPEKRAEGHTGCLHPELLAALMKRGLDGVVSGEPSGARLALEIRAQMIRSACLSRELNDVLTACDAQNKRVESLKECMNFALWEYVRVRLAPEVPPLSDRLAPGVPAELPGFAVGQLLRQGLFGAVYALTEVPDVGGPPQVARMVPKDNYCQVQDIRALSRTISILTTLATEQLLHPNIVRLYEAYQSPTHILFRQEYAGPENLYRRLVDRPRRPMGLERAVSIVTQIVGAIFHLHVAAQVCHRDIKPENLSVTDLPEQITVKLCNFDLAVAVKESMACRSQCGTLPFAAPEVMLHNRYDGRVADMWSFGVVLAEILCGVRVVETAVGPAPRDADPRGSIMANAAHIRAFFEQPGAAGSLAELHCRPELRDLLPICRPLLTGMLVVDVSQRVTASETHEAVEGLRHLSPGPTAA